MVRAKLLAYGAYNAKQGVEVTRGYQYVVFFGKEARKVVLGACFSEAACDAYHYEPFVALYYSFCVVVVAAVYSLFNGCVH